LLESPWGTPDLESEAHMEAVTQRPGQQAGDAADAQGVRSIRRALDILSLLNDDKPVISIRDITDATSLPKTTVLRLVHTLEQSGLLWATAGGYTAGPGLWRWAYLARRSWQLPPETQATMRDLGTEHRETVNLYVLRDICRVCVAQQESPRALRHVVQVGDELPLWGGASSKILLSDAPEALLVRVASRSPAGPEHLETLRQWAADARRDGYAVSHGEREEGISAVSVPVTGRSGAVTAALALSGPTLRFTADRVTRFAADLKLAGARMSERGFDHPLGPAT
jgi:DNA-binding IclR family transcriptional regulator